MNNIGIKSDLLSLVLQIIHILHKVTVYVGHVENYKHEHPPMSESEDLGSAQEGAGADRD